jgi:hypothetical protein
LPTANVTILQRSLTEWAARPGNRRMLHDEQREVLSAGLENPQRSAQVPVAAWLLGTWHLTQGEVRVLDGDAAGWDEARIGLGMLRSSLLLRARRHRQRPGHAPDEQPFPLLQAAHTVALGMALDDPLGGELAAVFAGLPDRVLGAGDAWPAFVRALADLRAGARPTVTQRLGHYLEVLTLWDGDPQPFARALQRVLDHHLEQTGGAGGSADFREPWVALFPLEVLAVQRTRTLLGLRTPKVEHPMMFTHFVTMVPSAGWPADALLQKLEREHLRR